MAGKRVVFVNAGSSRVAVNPDHVMSMAFVDENRTILTLSDSSRLDVQHEIIALGAALGFDVFDVNAGIVRKA